MATVSSAAQSLSLSSKITVNPTYYTPGSGQYYERSSVFDSETLSFSVSGIPAGSSINSCTMYWTQNSTTSYGGTAKVNNVEYTTGSYSMALGAITSASIPFYYKSRAVSGAGGSPTTSVTQSISFSNVYITVNYTRPTAPTVSGVTLAGSTSTRYAAAEASLTLAWSASNGTNNTISSYTIQRSDDGADYVNIKTGQTTKSYTVTAHPTAGKYYRYRVIAVAPYGNSTAVTSPAVYTYSNPTPPSTVSVNPTTVYTGENVTATWNAGGAGTGVAISKYALYCNDTKVGETTALSLTVATPSTAGDAVYKVKTIGNVSGYDSVLSTASATVAVENPRSTGTLNKSSVEMDGVSTIGITVTPSNVAYAHKVVWYTSLHSVTHELAVGVTSDTLSPVPLNWCSAYPNSATGTANAKLETYNGETKIGEIIYPFSVSVPSSVVPTISELARTPVDGYADGYLKGISKVQLTATASGAQGSTIIAYTMVGGGSTGNTNPWTSPILSIAGSNPVSVTVTDSRGRTATKTESISVSDYSNPVVSQVSAVRCISDGTPNNDGTYVSVTATLSVTSLSGNNPIASASVEYRERGTESWTLGASTLVSATPSVIGANNIAITDAYEIRISLTDTVGRTTVYTSIISPSSRLYDFRTDRAGIGRVAGDVSKQLVVPADWTTNINASKLNGKSDTDFALLGHNHDSAYLGITAQSVDSDKLDGYHASDLMVGNPNILHNCDFRNPVNQRDVSGAISTGAYFYDRWIRNSGTVTTNAAYLTIGAGAVIEQRIEFNLLAGKIVTVSVDAGGAVYSGTGTMPSADGTASVTITGWGTATLGYAAGYMYVLLSPTAASDVQRGKLELGTVSTLHLDPPMDYTRNFLDCARYYFVNAGVFTGSQQSTSGRLNIPLLVPMRILPTYEGPSTFSFYAGNGTSYEAESPYFESRSNGSLVLRFTNATTLSRVVISTPASLKVEANAEL